MTQIEWLTSTDPRKMFEDMFCQIVSDENVGTAHYDLGDGHRLVLSGRKYRLIAQAMHNQFYTTRPPILKDEACTREGMWVSPFMDAMYWVCEMNVPCRPHRAHILREIVGNPFTLSEYINIHQLLSVYGVLNWNGNTVERIASDIYDSRNFKMLPILADAMEDAVDISRVPSWYREMICHFRGIAPHYRGCWALDAVLGYEALHK